MAWVDDYGQVGELVEDRDRGQILRIPGVCLKGPDATFAEDDLGVAPGHDMFCAHKQLLIGVRKAALQQDWLVDMGERVEQLEVLHVSGAHLDDVDFIKEGKLGDVHDLVTTGSPVSLRASSNSLIPFSRIPWKE